MIRVDTTALICPRCGMRRDEHEDWTWYPMSFGTCRFQTDHDPGDEDRHRTIRNKYDATDLARTMPKRLADLILDEWWGPRASYLDTDPDLPGGDTDDPRGYEVVSHVDGRLLFRTIRGAYWLEREEND